MIKQLCICKIVRSRDAWVLINTGDPGLEDLVPIGKHKVDKPNAGWERRFFLAVTSDGSIPPNLISDRTNYAALPVSVITRKSVQTDIRDFAFFMWGGGICRDQGRCQRQFQHVPPNK